MLDATSSRNSDTWAILSIRYKEHLVFVPYVINRLQKEQVIDISTYNEEDSTNIDYMSVDCEKIGEDVKQKVLTEIFKSLYYKPNKFVDDNYEIYSNCNLKEI